MSLNHWNLICLQLYRLRAGKAFQPLFFIQAANWRHSNCCAMTTPHQKYHTSLQSVFNPPTLRSHLSLFSDAEMTGVKKQHRFPTVSVKTCVSYFNFTFSLLLFSSLKQGRCLSESCRMLTSIKLNKWGWEKSFLTERTEQRKQHEGSWKEKKQHFQWNNNWMFFSVCFCSLFFGSMCKWKCKNPSVIMLLPRWCNSFGVWVLSNYR